LKARFDEENNLKWAKKLKRAGAKLIYSSVALKVHAKIALVKIKQAERMHYYGLLGTGNFNETTAGVYTDHILATANRDILREVEIVFLFLITKDKPGKHPDIHFDHLLVSKFNLHQRFMELVDREIYFAKKGQEAGITIKLNNLEERKLISKLYDASRAGVKINLLVRGICCLIPGIEGTSDNISIKRIIDRYLEHGRIFIFTNNGNEEMYLGSADWMDRNIYRRIEVCFPILDAGIKQQLKQFIQLQLDDNVQAVSISSMLENVPVANSGPPIQSQHEIYKLLAN
jgi:polyphosphate kinase